VCLSTGAAATANAKTPTKAAAATATATKQPTTHDDFISNNLHFAAFTLKF